MVGKLTMSAFFLMPYYICTFSIFYFMDNNRYPALNVIPAFLAQANPIDQCCNKEKHVFHYEI